MDRNTIIGTVLIAVLIIAFYFTSKPSEEEIARMKAEREKQVEQQEKLAAEQKAQEEKEKSAEYIEEQAIQDSATIAQNALRFPNYKRALNSEEELTTVESDLLKLTISNKGGKIVGAELKEYKTYSQEPLVLLNKDNVFGFELSIGELTDNMFFQKQEQSIVKTDSTSSIAYRLYADSVSYIEYVYTLKNGSYNVGFQINTNNMDAYVPRKKYQLHWETTAELQEKTKKGEDIYTNLVWKYYQDEIDYTNARVHKDESKDLNNLPLKWIAFKQHFFSAVLIANESFKGDEVTSSPVENDTILKKFTASLNIPSLSDENSVDLAFYIGPNHYPTLKKQGVQLEGILDLGWFGFITKAIIIPIFNWLSSFIGSYGVIILLLTLIIKLSLFPLTFKSYLSTARMRVLKPQTEAINSKYPDKSDAMKRQQETMGLYRKAGVNPLGGCLPMLIQFPFLLAMFRFFPASFELRQRSFLWADDLSSYDSILNLGFDIPFYGDHISLFTLLMAGSMIIVNRINSANMNTSTPGMPNMKVMMMIMSIMMVFWFNSYSAGLSYYYFLANLITITQTLVIRQMIDDSKILAKIEANKKKPKKKSKFQQRLEDMQKQQKQIRR